jgi:hypothetical protein
MSFLTMKAMLRSLFGLEELENVPMPRNYTSEMVRVGKAVDRATTD